MVEAVIRVQTGHLHGLQLSSKLSKRQIHKCLLFVSVFVYVESTLSI